MTEGTPSNRCCAHCGARLAQDDKVPIVTSRDGAAFFGVFVCRACLDRHGRPCLERMLQAGGHPSRLH